MKRVSSSLVNYSSSDDDNEGDQAPAKPQNKKRKLLPVSSTIVQPAPIDDPSLHQGRVRTTPHAEGQFAAHVYVSLALRRHSLLYKIVQDIICDSKKIVPTLQEIWPNPDSTQCPELHISLSRPIFLRAHQREDLKRVVKQIAQANKAFTVSFAILSELINDEKTRTFLTMEVGAGHHELRSLADALTPTLRAIRQQEYYVNPRFHASLAWALLHRSQGTSIPRSGSSDSICTPRAISEDPPAPSIAPSSGTTTPKEFPAIDCLPADMIKMLNERYGAHIASSKVGSFEVHAITVKIGKEDTCQ